MDDEVIEETQGHRDILGNEDPAFVHFLIGSVVGFVQTYGWFLVLGVTLIIYLYNKYRPQLQQWQDRREAAAHKKMDSGVFESRMEAVERARQRMQAQLDQQAEQFMEKQKQREEEKRQAKLEDWERHQQGKGYRSKIRPQEGPASTPGTTGSSGKPKPKKTLRGEYSPLMGDSGASCSYRPQRRGGASGGG